MNALALLDWSAWSPGLTSRSDWLRWAEAPGPLGSEGAPEIRFLPALQRRRCDALSRMCLHVVNEVCPEAERAEVRSVFASRHGSFQNMAAMLVDLADAKRLSPNRFSHSVHNTQAGIFSMWANNREASTCVAAGAETFGAGLLESLGMLRRHPEASILFVMGDEGVPEPFDTLAPPSGSYALALLLRSGVDGAGVRLGLGFEPGEIAAELRPYPDALVFLRWWLTGRKSLRLTHPRRGWRFERDPLRGPAAEDE